MIIQIKKLENIDKELLLKAYEQKERIKKQQKEYRKINKDLINSCTKKYYDKMKNDPEFLERRRQNQRDFYQRNKDKLKEKRGKEKLNKKE